MNACGPVDDATHDQRRSHRGRVPLYPGEGGSDGPSSEERAGPEKAPPAGSDTTRRLFYRAGVASWTSFSAPFAGDVDGAPLPSELRMFTPVAFSICSESEMTAAGN